MTFVTRFAPSPTGFMHLGHAFSALTVFRAAQAKRGIFILRMEDLDFTRCKPEYEEAIIDDLRWLGIKWDGDVWRQSERRAEYAARLQSLIDRNLVYRCFRSRKEIEEITAAPHGQLPQAVNAGPLPAAEEEDKLAQGVPFSWRLSNMSVGMALEQYAADLRYAVQGDDGDVSTHPVQTEAFDGIILARKDIGTSYHLASVHDDDAANVSHIIRGEDLADAAPLHRLLYALFGLRAPTYHHHTLITNAQGKRLAKRDSDLSLQQLRKDGASPEDIMLKVGLPIIK
ncbi:MAG: tRNA glutamyl-Q(34) synthetase GluQRS [Pseudomonadota bacterium]